MSWQSLRINYLSLQSIHGFASVQNVCVCVFKYDLETLHCTFLQENSKYFWARALLVGYLWNETM